MNIKALEDSTVHLPLRLSGESPWSLVYRYTDPETNESEDTRVEVSKADGDYLSINRRGKYSLVEVNDAFCPGEIPDASVFNVDWYPRPSPWQ